MQVKFDSPILHSCTKSLNGTLRIGASENLIVLWNANLEDKVFNCIFRAYIKHNLRTYLVSLLQYLLKILIAM
jgi:hypothetical protein